ncbi:hypothetical protein C0Q70_20822 [Pomacea canaliculata]|uniref:THAP4-like heme-binding domain-containing protein n=2 Tax=Pomacea canaliculata TaxID=400727 RepID=A0A2T7NAS2_POMCA|nr:THAP domain-containing protein 4-like isoform X2 [Pomacea canaliculata]XP_025079024.1 THAP domain-containing protein 4-like isoform X2 [Pomacea canaliculata]PVD18273.1 hypothetical protein C0Q70_20822 [Pomacea canaliculata]
MMNDAIKPLAWLLGRWQAEKGQGVYPTISDFKYGEEVEFFHVGQPNVQFSFYSWNPETKRPMHREIGFIRIKPGTNKVALMCAHNFGVSEVQEGEVTENRLQAETVGITRMSFAKDPETKKVSRIFCRTDDELEQVVSMETSNTPMTEHLRIKYKKVQ